MLYGALIDTYAQSHIPNLVSREDLTRNSSMAAKYICCMASNPVMDEAAVNAIIVSRAKMTVQNSAIGALFEITNSAEILSQMNPLSKTGVSGIVRRGNPG
jgi:hypothetical protein